MISKIKAFYSESLMAVFKLPKAKTAPLQSFSARCWVLDSLNMVLGQAVGSRAAHFNHSQQDAIEGMMWYAVGLALDLMQLWWIPDPALQDRDNPQGKRKLLLKKPALTPEDSRQLWTGKSDRVISCISFNNSWELQGPAVQHQHHPTAKWYLEIWLQQIRKSIYCRFLLVLGLAHG